jgi:geranylgeranyl pyrophosphate synthase
MVSDICPAEDGNGFQIYLNELKQSIELELATLVTSDADSSLNEKIRYAISSSGKRLRPILVLMSAEAVGGRKEDAMHLALAVELMHTASLVHDDILDGDKIRRNKLTLHARWSVEEAILAGDALISISLGLLANYGEAVLGALAGTGMDLCEGEYLDVRSAAIPSENEYMKMIHKKCASLFMAATKTGATVGGGSQGDVDALGRFGEHFGMAFQINDDLADLVPKNGGVPQDLKVFRMSLPLIHLYESLGEFEKEALFKDLKSLESKDTKQNESVSNCILSRLNDSGSIEYCRSKIRRFVDLSVDDLSSSSFNAANFMQILKLLENSNY